MAETIEGGCLCGAVRFAIELPTKWCAHCHCSMCRRAHGAPFVTWVGVDTNQFRWVEHGALRSHASSPEATRSFCGTCGSMMTFESSRWAGEVHIARACILGDIDRAPRKHVFYESRADWVRIPVDEVPE